MNNLQSLTRGNGEEGAKPRGLYQNVSEKADWNAVSLRFNVSESGGGFSGINRPSRTILTGKNPRWLSDKYYVDCLPVRMPALTPLRDEVSLWFYCFCVIKIETALGLVAAHPRQRYHDRSAKS